MVGEPEASLDFTVRNGGGWGREGGRGGNLAAALPMHHLWSLKTMEDS